MRERPLARRAERIARPARVRIRSRKPCFLWRRRLFGWKVRLLTRGSSAAVGLSLRRLSSGVGLGAMSRIEGRVRSPAAGAHPCSPGPHGAHPYGKRSGTRWRAHGFAVDATRPQNVTGYQAMRSNGARGSKHLLTVSELPVGRVAMATRPRGVRRGCCEAPAPGAKVSGRADQSPVVRYGRVLPRPA